MRTLPHFKINDLSPKSRGFVTSSYRNGLKPVEFFFHAMGGREGLVDTAVRTSTSGYMQRRLVNALQDMVIENDGTVRNSDKNIIQFVFGDDGVEPTHTDHGKAVNLDVLLLKAKALDVEEIRKELKKKPAPKKTAPKKKPAPKKTVPKKKLAPKKTAPKKKPASKKSSPKKTTPEKKPVKKTDSKPKPKAAADEESLQRQYEGETGKKAIWRGKETKGFEEWKK